jgi:hypothetical protein
VIHSVRKSYLRQNFFGVLFFWFWISCIDH